MYSFWSITLDLFIIHICITKSCYQLNFNFVVFKYSSRAHIKRFMCQCSSFYFTAPQWRNPDWLTLLFCCFISTLAATKEKCYHRERACRGSFLPVSRVGRSHLARVALCADGALSGHLGGSEWGRGAASCITRPSLMDISGNPLRREQRRRGFQQIRRAPERFLISSLETVWLQSLPF